MKSRLIALDQTVKETDNKNNKLVNLLNQEIDKQAEDYKQKTMSHLLNSVQGSAEKIKRLIQDSPMPEEPFVNSSPLESQIKGDALKERINTTEKTDNELLKTDTKDRMYEKDISPTKLRNLLREEDVLQSNRTSNTKPNKENVVENNEQFGSIAKQNQIDNKVIEFNNNHMRSPSKEFKIIPQQIPIYYSNFTES